MILDGEDIPIDNLEFINKKISSSDNDQKTDVFKFVKLWYDDSKEIDINTSGSTGKPKIISISKEKMEVSAKLTADCFKLPKKSVALLALPCNYIAGKMMIVRAAVNNWYLITTKPDANPLKTIDVSQKIDFAAFVPLQMEAMLDDVECREKLNKIGTIIIGGAPIKSSLKKQIETLKPICFETFGMTETISHIAIKPLNGNKKSDWFETLGATSISTDDRGCLVVNAPHFSKELIITNDLVELKDKHHFKWLGRLDNAINSGGVKLMPEQIERKLSGFISQPFFIGSLAHPKLGQEVCLFIEGQKIDEAALAQPKWEQYEKPKSVVYINKFERTISGKIKRKATLKKEGLI